MRPPPYILSVIDRNVVMRRMAISLKMRYENECGVTNTNARFCCTIRSKQQYKS